MDVFIVSIAVCLMQIGMLSEFLIPPVCGFLDGLVPYGFVEERDMMCFFVDSYLGYGILWALISAVSGTILLQIVQGCAMSALHEREQRIKGIVFDMEINLGYSKKMGNLFFRMLHKTFVCDVARKHADMSDDAKEEMKRRAESISPNADVSFSGDDDYFVGDDSFHHRQSGDSIKPPPPDMPVPANRNALPPGWTEHDSENGIYYWNQATGEVCWEIPAMDDLGDNTQLPPINEDDDDEDDILPPPEEDYEDDDIQAPPPEEDENDIQPPPPEDDEDEFIAPPSESSYASTSSSHKHHKHHKHKDRKKKKKDSDKKSWKDAFGMKKKKKHEKHQRFKNESDDGFL